VKDKKEKFIVQVAGLADISYAEELCHLYEDSAKKRGTGIAKREPDYIEHKILEGKAIIAFREGDHTLAGFCYIETWEGKNYVANSGLIVKEEFRHHGLAKRIKNSRSITRQKNTRTRRSSGSLPASPL
jgi:hypothetical protein